MLVVDDFNRELLAIEVFDFNLPARASGAHGWTMDCPVISRGFRPEGLRDIPRASGGPETHVDVLRCIP